MTRCKIVIYKKCHYYSVALAWTTTVKRQWKLAKWSSQMMMLHGIESILDMKYLTVTIALLITKIRCNQCLLSAWLVEVLTGANGCGIIQFLYNLLRNACIIVQSLLVSQFYTTAFWLLMYCYKIWTMPERRFWSEIGSLQWSVCSFKKLYVLIYVEVK